MKMMRKQGVLLAAILLSACGSDGDPGPGGVTRGEAEALDEAAEMLDARKLPPLPAESVPAAREASASPAG